MDALVKQWREDTPGCAKQIHLNNAGSGLMPRAVLEAITAHLNREANFGGYESADDAEAAVAEAYANVARVLGARPRNVAVVENSTVAFFQALSAFDFKAGDAIVTTRNDYISNQLAYLSLARRHGVEVRRAADLVSGGADPQSVKELFRDPRWRSRGCQPIPA
jgi:selenocysteine lyase/cysteine desulfurase